MFQTLAYYPPQQYEPADQQYSGGGNTICIHLCMPSCENQCIERTTAAPYTGYSGLSGTHYTNVPSSSGFQTLTTPYSSSYQSSIPPTQAPIIIRPQQGATICIPICMPSCQAQCTESQQQSGPGTESYQSTYGTQGPMSTQTESPPHEISISLPQSIQQSPNCLSLCHETCMQQCTGQGSTILKFRFT